MSAGIETKEANMQTNHNGEADSLTQANALMRKQNDSFNGNLMGRKTSNIKKEIPEARTNTSMLQ